MIRYALTTVLLVLVLSATAQNLVPNPSFELYNQPCSLGANYQSLNNWGKPNCALGGFTMSTCNSFSNGVPDNFYGSSYPVSGDSYAVIRTFNPNSDNDNPKRYMSVPLAQTLNAGLEYCIALWVSLADSSTHTTQALHCWAYSGSLSTCNDEDLSWAQLAQVTLDLALVDSAQWYLLQGSFIADGSENQLVIGSFLHGTNIDTTFVRPSPIIQALYFIDDVYLGPCDAVGIEELKEQELVVYPNPATDWVHLELPYGMKKGSVRIVDMSGRVLKEKMVSKQVERLDVRDLADGMYQLLLLGKKGTFKATTTLVVTSE